MTKINQGEYEKLKSLGDQWEWIARDLGGNRAGNLFAYSGKPFKHDVGVWDYGRGIHHIDNHLFQFVKWEDPEPYNISELIEEYEYSADHVSHVINERVKALGNAWKESEETEVKKDKEWLLDTFRSKRPFNNNFSKGYVLEKVKQLDEPNIDGLEVAIEELYECNDELIRDNNQLRTELDNQETLSKRWIGKNEFLVNDESGVDYTVVESRKLKGVLVPKQEDLETKIQELIELYKKEIEDTYSNPENFQIVGFIEDLKGLVEKEQKYYVLNSEGETMIRKSDSRVRTSSGFKIKNGFEGENYKFTEQEIKDYDERYIPFMVPVDEVNND